MFTKIWLWWTWRNAHKIIDPKLRKAMLRGIITPKEALITQNANTNMRNQSL